MKRLQTNGADISAEVYQYPGRGHETPCLKEARPALFQRRN